MDNNNFFKKIDSIFENELTNGTIQTLLIRQCKQILFEIKNEVGECSIEKGVTLVKFILMLNGYKILNLNKQESFDIEAQHSTLSIPHKFEVKIDSFDKITNNVIIETWHHEPNVNLENENAVIVSGVMASESDYIVHLLSNIGKLFFISTPKLKKIISKSVQYNNYETTWENPDNSIEKFSISIPEFENISNKVINL